MPEPDTANLLNRLVDPAWHHLPEWWWIEIAIYRGEVSISLYDPDGRDIEVCTDDLADVRLIQAHVDEARRRAGLKVIEWAKEESEYA